MKRIQAIRALRLNYKWRGVWVYLRGYNRIHRCRGVVLWLRDPDRIITEQNAIADGAFL